MSDECHDNYSSEVNINLKKRKTSYGVVFELEYDNENWHFTGTAEEVLEELSEHMENMLAD